MTSEQLADAAVAAIEAGDIDHGRLLADQALSVHVDEQRAAGVVLEPVGSPLQPAGTLDRDVADEWVDQGRYAEADDEWPGPWDEDGERWNGEPWSER